VVASERFAETGEPKDPPCARSDSVLAVPPPSRRCCWCADFTGELERAGEDEPTPMRPSTPKPPRPPSEPCSSSPPSPPLTRLPLSSDAPLRPPPTIIETVDGAADHAQTHRGAAHTTEAETRRDETTDEARGTADLTRLCTHSAKDGAEREARIGRTSELARSVARRAFHPSTVHASSSPPPSSDLLVRRSSSAVHAS
jgi:hypothetical protein